MESKVWWKSKTLISIAMAAVGVIAPKYTPVITQAVGDVVTLASLVSAFYSRLTTVKQLVLSATKPPQQ